jgi:tetratricopeptide (TPR) repeat protein
VLAATADHVSVARVRLLHAAGLLPHGLGDERGTGYIEAAWQMLPAVGNPPLLRAEISNRMAIMRLGRGDVDAAYQFALESLALWEACERPADAARIQHNLGLIARDQRRFAEALQQFEASLAFFQARQDRARCAIVFGNLSSVLLAQGKPQEARQRAEMGWEIARELQTPNLTYNLYYLLDAVIAERDGVAIWDVLTEALQRQHQDSAHQLLSWLLTLMARWWWSRGDYRDAITLFGAAAGMIQRQATAPDNAVAKLRREAEALLTAQPQLVAAETAAQAWAGGEALGSEAALAYAQALVDRDRPGGGNRLSMGEH